MLPGRNLRKMLSPYMAEIQGFTATGNCENPCKYRAKMKKAPTERISGGAALRKEEWWRKRNRPHEVSRKRRRYAIGTLQGTMPRVI